LKSVVFHSLQNRRQEGAKAIKQDILHELNEATAGMSVPHLELVSGLLPNIELGISKRKANFSPIEFIRSHILLSLGCATLHHLPVLGIEEPSLTRIVGKAEPDSKSAYDAEYSLNNIDPSMLVSLKVS
jgi:hypothetical protein